jgi:phosphate starvation-inducible PhoH-like protein
LDLTLNIPEGHLAVAVVGPAERNLKLIREALGVSVSARNGTVRITGDQPEITIARNVMEQLTRQARSESPMTRDQVLGLITDESEHARRSSGGPMRDSSGWDGTLNVHSGGRRIKPKGDAQAYYLEAIRTNDMVFGIGPAGTGKTYLAVAAAVHLLREQRVSRVILCRPAVEAGEKLGFLPGDLEAKVNPYLRPLLDALHDMVPYNDIRRLMETDLIEVVPLAFMRGRTLNNALVILDEAQNTTCAQMKMFLTRMGHGSKVIITGDTTQIDLPDPRKSGLIDAARRLRRVKGIAFVQLTAADVVRHPLVQRVIEAYADPETGDGFAEPAHVQLQRDLAEALAGSDTLGEPTPPTDTPTDPNPERTA